MNSDKILLGIIDRIYVKSPSEAKEYFGNNHTTFLCSYCYVFITNAIKWLIEEIGLQQSDALNICYDMLEYGVAIIYRPDKTSDYTLAMDSGYKPLDGDPIFLYKLKEENENE